MIKETKRTLKRIAFFAARSLLSKETRSPAYLGRTFAVGFCAGMFMIYGQSLLCLAIWLVMDRWLKLRFSVLIASLLTFISNPLTTPFILYLYYLTGQAMLGDSVVSLRYFLVQTRILLTNIDRGNLWEGLKLVTVGIGWPIALGSLPWHVIMTFVGYKTGVRVHWRLNQVMERKKISQTERKAGGNRRVTE
jgi:uncharacterized protein (DUF2062 family)